MRTVVSDLWTIRLWLVVTTNLAVRADGKAVMGRGIAAQAAENWPDLPRWYGRRLRAGGRGLVAHEGYHLLFLPVKVGWRDPADPGLLEASLAELASFASSHPADAIATPVPGIGFGGLARDVVEPLLQRHLGPVGNVVVVERAAEVQARYGASFRAPVHQGRSL